MWWDLFPTFGYPRRVDADALLLMVMEEILMLDSIACQEAAIHGLGHWHEQYPLEVEAILKRFLAKNPSADDALIKYAQQAGHGFIQ
jgi:hypothetical protein